MVTASKGVASHTLGPWTVKDTPGEVQILGRHSNNVHGGKKPARLAIVLGWDDETMANARLIASSPTMLEALQVAEGRFANLADADEATPSDLKAWRKVKGAIAKAKGAS